MYIKHEDGCANGNRDQDHGEDQVLAQEGHGQRGRRDSFDEDRQEEDERDQDRDGKRYLCA